MTPETLCTTLAAALRYPGPDTPATVARAATEAEPEAPALAAALRELSAWIAADGSRAQERYTQLFDLAPLCAPHVGWHLFGEDYSRGLLLAQLRPQLRAAGIACNGELPDHLTLLLELLARLEDAEDRALLVRHLLLPGVTKMAAAVADARDPYPALLRALPSFLEPRS